MNCPNCSKELNAIPAEHGVHWKCDSCKGRAIGVGFLRKSHAPDIVAQIWKKAQHDARVSGKKCPSCSRTCFVVQVPPALGDFELDICAICLFIWFDYQELSRIPKRRTGQGPPPKGPKPPPIPTEAKEEVAFLNDVLKAIWET